jgi:hypothetical protein
MSKLPGAATIATGVGFGAHCGFDWQPIPDIHDPEGEIELTFRGDAKRAAQGSTMNVTANAPRFFSNASDRPARLLRRYTPVGQEEFFMSVGDPVSSRTLPLPTLCKMNRPSACKNAKTLAAKYRMELRT